MLLLWMMMTRMETMIEVKMTMKSMAKAPFSFLSIAPWRLVALRILP